VRSLAAIPLLLASAAAAQTPGFWLMGSAPSLPWSKTYALSQDGSVAAGYSTGAGFAVPGFTWTQTTGRQDLLGTGIPAATPAYGLSSDGTTVVGAMANPGPTRAYRRIGNGPLQDLGTGGYQSSMAFSVSGDGSVVAGYGETVSGGLTLRQALRWTAATGFQPLGWLGGGAPYSTAHAVSRDGATVVGESGSVISQAFVWRQSTGIQALPPLPGVSGPSSRAFATNADGSVIVGDATAPDTNHHAVLWGSGSPVDLGTLPGCINSLAFGVSDDGSVVGGSSLGIGILSAFIWTPSSGMLALSDYLGMYGVSIPPDWNPSYIYAVSGDGRTFAGEAVNASGVIQGFVATVPAPAGAVVLLLPALLRRRCRAIR